MSARTLIKDAKLWQWRTILKVVGYIIGVVIAGIVIYRLFVLPDVLRKEVGEAKQDERAATATVNTMQAGEELMDERERTIVQTREIVRENTHEIRSAPGASDRVPPAVHDAFVNSIERLRAVRGPDDGR